MKSAAKYCFLFLGFVGISIWSDASNLPYISGGSSHSLAVKSDWKVAAWGYSSFGQLGNGSAGTDESYTSVPVEAIGLSGIMAVAAGSIHSLALKSDGTVWAWGFNTYGQLGQGTTSNTNQPVNIVGLSSITAIAASFHSLALKSDGTVWAWGYNGGGEMGNGTGGTGGLDEYSTVPVQVSGLSGVIAIAAGGHSLAVKNDGTVWAWGYNNYGQLGDGTTTLRTTPVQVSGLSDVVAVAASSAYGHSLAVKNDGTVWAWGYNGRGALGDGTTTNRTTPVQVIGLSNVIDVAAGGSHGHSLALKSDGTVWAWGLNSDGQLGDGTWEGFDAYRTYPMQVIDLSGVIGIAAGSWFSMAVKNDSTVWTWGGNGYGQLGDGTTTMRTSPVQVSGGLYAPTAETSAFGGEGYEPVGGDYDGDGKADEAVYHEDSGYWYVEMSSSRATSSQKLGGTGYTPVSGDFDGDGKSDVAVYQESTGYWYIILSNSSSLSYMKFGESGYTPVPGDYDGDGKTDLAVYHESSGYWYILLSGSSYSLAYMKFGASGYAPVAGDYDGDGKTDLTVYHESSGYWYIFNSITYTLSYAQFGSSDCGPMIGDYDGDGKSDLTVYEESTAYWHILLSASGTVSSMKFGEPGYTPMPGDYDGDGKTDIAAYDESTGYWYIQPSSNY